MLEERFVISDRQWALMEPPCWGKKTDPCRPGGDGRLFLEAVLWIARTGSPWRDLPPGPGNWNTVFKRCRDWVKADVFHRMFDALSDEPDMELAMIDGAVVKVHRHGRGAKGGDQSRAIGPSKGGMTTKIVALSDALATMVRFLLLRGQAHDMKGVARLIQDVSLGALPADKAFDAKAFDADWLVQDLDERGATAVIAPKTNRNVQRDYDIHMYKCAA